MSQGLWVLVAVVALAAAYGGWRLLRDGRFAASSTTEAALAAESPAPDLPAGVELGERATLLQFSSAFCAPCRATRQVLGDVASAVPGVRHVELDAEQHLDAVRRLGILRTPTTLVLDAAGVEVTRAGGAPRKEDVLAALSQAIPGDNTSHISDTWSAE